MLDRRMFADNVNGKWAVEGSFLKLTYTIALPCQPISMVWHDVRKSLGCLALYGYAILK